MIMQQNSLHAKGNNKKGKSDYNLQYLIWNSQVHEKVQIYRLLHRIIH